MFIVEQLRLTRAEGGNVGKVSAVAAAAERCAREMAKHEGMTLKEEEETR